MKDVIIEYRYREDPPDFSEYYEKYERRIKAIEERGRELELRYNHNHDEKGRFTFSSGGGKYAKKVDKDRESGIINEREVEFGIPYGEHSVDADMDYINSDDYSRKFDNISDNPAVNRTLLECARKSIDHRNGTEYEDMYFIHAETGEILAKQVEMTYPSGISYNDEIKDLLKRSKEKGIPLVTIHNHPEGYPPSVDDLNKSYDNGTIFGIAAGHNGQVYKYNNPGKKTYNAENIHDVINIRCSGGTDPDRAYAEEFKLNGLSYEIIKGE